MRTSRYLLSRCLPAGMAIFFACAAWPAAPAQIARPSADLLQEFPLQVLMDRAEAGDPHAQFRLGGRYALGEGVRQDDAVAVRWWRLAASQGLAEAQNELGTALADGHGVDRDPVQAVHWLTLAAGQGLAVAQANLATMYSLGTGVRKNERRAVQLYRLAADQGLGWAQFYLGEAYERGRGVAPAHGQAVLWYRKAAEQDYGDAMFSLGALYRRMPATLPTVDSAVLDAYGEYWIARAARQGIHEATRYLDGMLHSTCRGQLHRAAGAVRTLPDETTPVLLRVSGEQACVLPKPGRTSRALDGWAAVYLSETVMVGFMRKDDLHPP